MTERLILNQHPARGGPEALKILVADAHPLMRQGLGNVLAGLCQRVDVLQADSLHGALAELDAHPDTALVLLDLIMPDGEGTIVLERVREARPEVPIVVVSAATDHATIMAAVRGGARGFISKRSPPPVLLSALRLVLAGEVYVPPEVLRTQLVEPSRGAPLPAGERVRSGQDPDLTKRQLDVLALLVQGKPNKVICRELGLAEGTVKAHTAAIFRVLRVSNRTEAGFAVSSLGLQIPAGVGSPTTAPHPFAPRRLLAAA